MTDFNFNTIALIRSCYNEKFGIPRQSGLVENADAVIEMQAPYNDEDFIRELEGFSHIWLIFVFHQHIGKPVKATVRPPRLGGNQRVGVFASRSPFRPNPIGISVVKLNKISKNDNTIELHISGADLLNGTPVIDIKPYVSYADSIAGASSSYASDKPEAKLEVSFSALASQYINEVREQYPKLRDVIQQTLSLDPRPAYIKDREKHYGLSVFDFNVQWRVEDTVAEVIRIEKLT
ncbi:MAG: tRNA (N6-threonylcarbamoyladenosine(37)-N6)-methyltransferase TrmO [Gammaproteobacteria bacterium]|nr:tRNA (N6-threonylcarbamoyladenosine(37)-N6)-methyltransferase TrmO [Gammaproteobacteria bacterium]